MSKKRGLRRGSKCISHYKAGPKKGRCKRYRVRARQGRVRSRGNGRLKR